MDELAEARRRLAAGEFLTQRQRQLLGQREHQFLTQRQKRLLADAGTSEIPGTRAEVVAEAIAAGLTQVRTLGGWVDLEDWTPYGKKEGHHVEFRLVRDQIREEIPGMLQVAVPQGYQYGVWEVR